MATIGLLAYGSLRWDPRDELEEVLDFEALVRCAETPFRVEFARHSRTRDGCPTLMPVETGGARVPADLIPFRGVSAVNEAQTLVWRREVGRSDGDYDSQRDLGPNKVYVEPVVGVAYESFDVVLSVRVASNIASLRGDVLAELAIGSARAEAGARRQDGISYLIDAKRHGVETPLRADYESAILRRLGVTSLEGAWHAARALESRRG